MGTSLITWAEARKGFLTHLRGIKAPKTVRYYGTQLTGLCCWADTNGVQSDNFGKRHLDQFLSDRLDLGAKRTTLHHDALAAKVFFKWCAKNDILDKSPLADYTVAKAPVPEKYMPTDEDMRSLLEAISSFWDREKNPQIIEVSAARRSFHRERNYALILLIVDTAARIGELLSLWVVTSVSVASTATFFPCPSSLRVLDSRKLFLIRLAKVKIWHELCSDDKCGILLDTALIVIFTKETSLCVMAHLRWLPCWYLLPPPYKPKPSTQAQT